MIIYPEYSLLFRILASLYAFKISEECNGIRGAFPRIIEIQLTFTDYPMLNTNMWHRLETSI